MAWTSPLNGTWGTLTDNGLGGYTYTLHDKATTTVQEDPDTGDAIITFPDDMMEELGWKEGDLLDFSVENGVFIVKKVG